MLRPLMIGAVVSAALAGPSFASCDDIMKTCHDSYMLELASCDRNSAAGADREACKKRAADQFNYCHKQSGCSGR